MKYAFIILSLFFVTCNLNKGTEPQIETQSPFSIRYGEVKYFEPLKTYVGFKEVKEDSRCPNGVVCVWAGQAVLNMWIKSTNTDTVYINAPIVGKTTKDDTKGHKTVDTAGYSLSVYQLDPYPEANNRQPKEAYVALINLTKSK